MALNTDYRTPVQLTAAARAAAAAAANGLYLNQFLPDTPVESLSFSFDASGKQTVDVAEFRSFDTEAPYGTTPGGMTKEGRLPPISRKLPVSEFTELQYSGRGEAIGNVLDTYAARLGQGIAVRSELAKGEAIQTGRLVINENGLRATITYGRKTSHTVTAPAMWDAVGATPITDIETWVQIVTTDAGAPTTALVSRRILAALSKNADIIAFAVGRATNLPSRVSYDDVRDVLRSFGISNVVDADEVYSEVVLPKRPVADNVFILLPGAGSTVFGGSLGQTEMGVPAEAIQPSYGIAEGERPGIFAGAFGRTDPEGLNVLASAILLPVLVNPNSTLAATVLAAG